MFNGIIFNKGYIKKISKRSKGINIFVKSDFKLNFKDIGVSIACDGVCLTLINIHNKIMEFYLSNETVKRSNRYRFKNNSEVDFKKLSNRDSNPSSSSKTKKYYVANVTS